MKKIAIANPQHAPYGRAAVAALEACRTVRSGSRTGWCWARMSRRRRSSWSRATRRSGSWRWRTPLLRRCKGKGKYWEVPAEAYPPLAQGVVVLSHSKHKKEAAEFLEYIKTKEAAELLRRYGFTLPEK